MKFDCFINNLLLEQPHMDFDVQGYNVLFDPKLEECNYQQGVILFKRIMSGEEVNGKYDSVIQIPKGLEKDFVKALINDDTTMSFIKLWLSALGRKTNAGYTIKQFFIDTGMYSYVHLNEGVYRVSHSGLGISEKTTALDKNQAIRNVFGRLLNDKKINKYDFNKFKDAKVDLLESKANFDVKCISGPYWLPDKFKHKGEGFVDEVFGYECSLNGRYIIMGKDNIDGSYHAQVAGDAVYNFYTDNIKVLKPLFEKAINQFKQKQKAKEAGASEREADTIVKI